MSILGLFPRLPPSCRLKEVGDVLEITIGLLDKENHLKEVSDLLDQIFTRAVILGVRDAIRDEQVSFFFGCLCIDQASPSVLVRNGFLSRPICHVECGSRIGPRSSCMPGPHTDYIPRTRPSNPYSNKENTPFSKYIPILSYCLISYQDNRTALLHDRLLAQLFHRLSLLFNVVSNHVFQPIFLQIHIAVLPSPAP